MGANAPAKCLITVNRPEGRHTKPRDRCVVSRAARQLGMEVDMAALRRRMRVALLGTPGSAFAIAVARRMAEETKRT